MCDFESSKRHGKKAKWMISRGKEIKLIKDSKICMGHFTLWNEKNDLIFIDGTIPIINSLFLTLFIILEFYHRFFHLQ